MVVQTQVREPLKHALCRLQFLDARVERFAAAQCELRDLGARAFFVAR